MKRENIQKYLFLFTALVMFIMVPIYCFILMENTLGVEKWVPVLVFLGAGILCLVNYYLIHIEHLRKTKQE